MKQPKLFPDEYNARTYANHFRRLVDAERNLKKGLDELTEIRQEMEVEYTRQFPQQEHMQLYRDAGIVADNNDPD